jgi:hypothetical protein
LEAANAETKIRSQQNATRIPNFGKAVAMNKSILNTKLDDTASSGSAAGSNVLTFSPYPIRNPRPVSWAGGLQKNSVTVEAASSGLPEKLATGTLVPTATTSTAPLESKVSKNTGRRKTKRSSSSSSSSDSSSPTFYKFRKPQKYRVAVPTGGLGGSSSDEDYDLQSSLTLGYRRGQPPRGEVVVKMTGRAWHTIV